MNISYSLFSVNVLSLFMRLLLFDSSAHACYNIFTTFVRFGGKPMKKLPQISEGEFEVMKVIWRKAPVSTTEVTDELTRVTSGVPKRFRQC